MGLEEKLLHKKVSIDTAPFIYYMERHPHFGSIVKPIFEEIEKGNIEAITANITVQNVLKNKKNRCFC